MARPKTPTAEKLRNGTYRPSRHGPIAAAPDAAEPPPSLACPPSLSGRAAEVWADLAEQLRGVIRTKDVPALTELARWIERAERIAAELDTMPLDDKRFKTLLVAAGISTDKITTLTARFGLSPADRVRVPQDGAKVAQVPTRPKTKYDRKGLPK